MYKLNEEKMFFDISENQAVVIDFMLGTYYGTTTLGSVVLERLIKGNAPEDILKAIKALDKCPEDIDEKLEKFISQLKEEEMIIASETTKGGDEPFAEEVVSEGFALVLDIFSELRDLILADPVHDVKTGQGWPVLKED